MNKYRFVDGVQFRISAETEEQQQKQYEVIENLLYTLQYTHYLNCDFVDTTNESLAFFVYDLDTEDKTNAALTLINATLDSIKG